MPVSKQQETIDPRILRLIGLDDVFDLDYQTYFNELREALVKANMPGKGIPPEEFELLKDELKRVKSKKDKGRFEVKKKRITAQSFGVGSPKFLIKGTSKSPLLLKGISKSPLSEGVSGALATISSTLDSILATLISLNTISKNDAERDRMKRERDKRSKLESGLEKGISTLKKVTEKIIAPVKSILDRVFQFLSNVIIGRVLVKLLEWFSNPENASKVKSIGRFFKENWPKLLALYIMFGTSFGKFARGLISLVIGGTRRLIAAGAALAVKLGIGKAGGKLSKVAGFLGGTKGKLLAAGVETAITVGTTLALSKGLENFGGVGGGEQKAEPKTQKYSGGGYVKPKFPMFSGGGFNLKGMMGGASFGSMFGPLGMLLGGMFGTGKPQEMVGGFVSGEKGVDKVPAMLSDGEFVMSRGAVQKYGVDTLEAMNAAGGGTNRPTMSSGKTYASGGGYISKVAHHLKQDEALSSLSRGTNDYIKPGGKSVKSGKSWSTITPKTPIHSYVDSVGKTTIGWGSTFYDSILNGKKPVRPGDTITKEKADSILNTNIMNLAKEYGKKIPTWNKMNDDQKAGVILVGYNAPYGPIGVYKKLTAALASGDMITAAKEVQRGGPSASRISAERQLILSGPKDLSKITQSSKSESNAKPQQKPQTQQSPNIFQRVGSGFSSMFRGMMDSNSQSSRSVRKYNTGGLVSGESGQEQISPDFSKGQYLSAVDTVSRYGNNTSNKLNLSSDNQSISPVKKSFQPIKPPVKSSPRTSYSKTASIPSGLGNQQYPSSSSVPVFSASFPGGSSKKKTLGIVV